MTFSAIILAGGQSRRMGQDKAWLQVHGQSLLARQIQLVRTLGATEIFISGRAGTDYSPLNCTVLEDLFKDAGPLAGIERGLSAMSSQLLLVLAVDMPRMSVQPLEMLLSQCAEDRGAIPRVDGEIQPLAAVYPKAALTTAGQLLQHDRRAAKHFAECCVESKLAVFVELPQQHSGHFENWNTAADVTDAA